MSIMIFLTARIAHTCTLCSDKIEPGEHYWRSDEAYHPIKEHVSCPIDDLTATGEEYHYVVTRVGYSV